MVTFAEYKREQDRLAREQARKIIKERVSRSFDDTRKVSHIIDKGTRTIGRGVSSVSRALGGRPTKQVSTNLLRTFSGQQTRQAEQGQRPVGRPRGDYKHRDPKTGQPIPATEFYKRVKELRRQAQQKANISQIQQVQELARRGIPPSRATEIVDTRKEQMIQTKLQPPQQDYPEEVYAQPMQPQVPVRRNFMGSQVPRNIPRYGQRRTFVEADIFGNPRVKVSGDETSFWN
jgi:hypothetical protein